MKQINDEQINAILQTVYVTNIPASQFDALRKLLSELPPVTEVNDEKVKDATKK